MRHTCFSGIAVYGDIKVCENNHGELIKSTAIIKISYIYVIVFYYDEVNDLKQIHVPFLNVELLLRNFINSFSSLFKLS